MLKVNRKTNIKQEFKTGYIEAMPSRETFSKFCFYVPSPIKMKKDIGACHTDFVPPFFNRAGDVWPHIPCPKN